jgi:predicted Zn-dependent protease
MIRAMEERIQREPGNAQHRKVLGQVLFRAGDWKRAAHQLQEALRLDPGDLNTRVMLGMALWHGGDRSSALNHFNTVLQKEPSRNDVRFLRAMLLASQEGGRKEAVEELRRIILQNPDSPWAQRAGEQLEKLGAGAPSPEEETARPPS